VSEAAGSGVRRAFRVDDAAADRLDVVVARALDVSRTHAATLIANKCVRVNGELERASFRASAGDEIEVDLPPAPMQALVPESIPLRVVHEDDDLLIIDKPAGMVVHPAPGHWSGTVVNALLGRGSPLPRTSDPARAGLVHRLDKGTSGLLLVAKTDRAQRRLSAAIAARRVSRRYVVLCVGHLREAHTRVEASLARDPRDRRRVAVVATGRHAITDFLRIARYDAADLLRAHLHTGRTHQIRVHLASLGHPVIGDDTYGGGTYQRRFGLAPERHFLHAAWLRFEHPVTRVAMDVRCELPDDLIGALARAAHDETLIERANPLEYLGFFAEHG
jgi:23S rRNA pseudouridine1911/1915/1917 synthase